MADMTGMTLGSYRLTARLGRGGMAEVYRAYQPLLERNVAVKLMHGHLAEEENFVNRFKREAKAAAALRHPNIVQVYDFNIQNDLYYMVMEYIEGETLKQRLMRYNARNERMPLAEVARIFRALCAALDYAHEQGCLHRDLKPANIMFDGDRLVLTDFGIATIVGGTRYTASGSMVGTPAYMSPEQGMGEPGDVRSDVYALGIMLYEMVTGDVPFDANTPLAIVLKHLQEPLPLPRQLNARIPPAVERVILKALAKSSADRYQSAGALVDALEVAIESEDTIDISEEPTAILPEPTTPIVQTRSVESSDTPAPRQKKARWLTIGGIAVIILVFLGIVSALMTARNVEPEYPAPIEEAIPPDAVEHYERGMIFFDEQNYEDAIAEFSQVIAAAPDVADVYHLRGIAYREQYQFEQAESDLNRAIELNSEFAMAYFDRGLLYLHYLERPEDARADFDRTIELAPEFAEAYLRRARVYAWHLDDLERALPDLDRAIELDPDLAEAVRWRGDIYFWQGEYDRAVPDLVHATELDPDDTYSRAMLGMYHYREGNYAEAISRYDEALATDQTDLVLYYHRAFARAQSGADDAAREDFDKVLLLEPKHSGAHYGRGKLRYRVGQYEEAIADFAAAIVDENWQFADFYFPHDNPYFDRARAYLELGDIENALADLNTLIEMDLAWYEAYYQRGIIYKEQGRIEDAIADFTYLWENSPNEEWRGRVEDELRVLRRE